jgi:glutamine amidotransferase-like uncharacterized protein
MTIYGKIFKFRISVEDYDGSYESEIGICAGGYTEALKTLEFSYPSSEKQFIGEVEPKI